MDINFKKNNIKELRTDWNMTQWQLAEAIGTSQANVSRWEKGLIEPSIIECWKLAEYFGVSIDVLVGKEDY